MDLNQFNQRLFDMANRCTAGFMHTVFEKKHLLHVDDETKQQLRKIVGDGFHEMRRRTVSELRKVNEETDGSGTVQSEEAG